MVFDVVTLFPGIFDSPLRESILGRAVKAGHISVRFWNIRDYATDAHRTTDDSPYGGGCGMVMKPEPMVAAIEAAVAGGAGGDAAEDKPIVVLTSPQGRRFDQGTAEELAAAERVVIACGRYEGVDERVRSFVDLELSTGDFILTGGELAALIMIDAVSRLVPGVLGHEDSSTDDSFSHGLLEYPQYTRPETFRGMRVPEVLLSGNHEAIRRWRREEAITRTIERRPDLLENAELTDNELELVKRIR